MRVCEMSVWPPSGIRVFVWMSEPRGRGDWVALSVEVCATGSSSAVRDSQGMVVLAILKRGERGGAKIQEQSSRLLSALLRDLRV